MKKVYGPYTRKDGRQHVIHYDNETKEKRTQSYPRYAMEQLLGRELLKSEEVDHINDDPTDNRVDNFQILTSDENSFKTRKPKVLLEVNCAFCSRPFNITERRYRNNQILKGCAGPYCSRACSGKVHH